MQPTYRNSWYYDQMPPGILSFDEVHEWYWWSNVVRPSKYKIDSERVSDFQNQYLQQATRMACGSYMAAHACNAMNVEEWVRPEIDARGEKRREIQIEKYRGSREHGSYLNDNVRMSMGLGFVANIYNVRTIDEYKTALLKNHAICTGSRNINYRRMMELWEDHAIIGPGPGHLFTIIGYDDDKTAFLVKDSAGESLRDDGIFYIGYKDIQHLYPAIACIDAEDKEHNEKIKKDRELYEYAVQYGITNGQFLEAYAERRQAAIMFARAQYLAERWHIPQKDDNHWILRAVDQGIWNWDRPHDYVTRYEVALMCAWMLGIRTSDDKETIQKIIDEKIMQSAHEKETILRLHLLYVVVRSIHIIKSWKQNQTS